MKKEFKITINVVMEEEAALFLGDRLTGMFQDTDLSELIGTDFDAVMTYADGRELFPDDEDYYDNDWPDVFPPVLTLDTDDLLVNDIDKGVIKVSKDIFDDFQENTIIDIKFVDDNSEAIHTYQMIDEDEEGITMIYFGTEPTPDTVVF